MTLHIIIRFHDVPGISSTDYNTCVVCKSRLLKTTHKATWLLWFSQICTSMEGRREGKRGREGEEGKVERREGASN